MTEKNLDGELIKDWIVEEDYKMAKISPFDFVNAIHYSKENLIVDDWSEKQYNAFIVNKSLSFGADTVIPANEMNSRPHLEKKLQFDFLNSINTIRPRKRFNKWLKAEKIEDLELVKQYYHYNTEKALQALRILSPEELHTIKVRLNTGGLTYGTRLNKHS
jgi:hypothetical protein